MVDNNKGQNFIQGVSILIGVLLSFYAVLIIFGVVGGN
jgi:hypothetical protein